MGRGASGAGFSLNRGSSIAPAPTAACDSVVAPCGVRGPVASASGWRFAGGSTGGGALVSAAGSGAGGGAGTGAGAGAGVGMSSQIASSWSTASEPPFRSGIARLRTKASRALFQRGCVSSTYAENHARSFAESARAAGAPVFSGSSLRPSKTT